MKNLSVLNSESYAAWASAFGTFFAAVVALCFGLTKGKPKIEVVYKSIMKDPCKLTLFLRNVGDQPAYIVGYGFDVWFGGAPSMEARDGKIDCINPTMGGEVEIPLPDTQLNYICSGLSRVKVLGWFLRKGCFKDLFAYLIVRSFRAFVITGDGKRHYAKKKIKALNNLLHEKLLNHVKKSY